MNQINFYPLIFPLHCHMALISKGDLFRTSNCRFFVGRWSPQNHITNALAILRDRQEHFMAAVTSKLA
jgi:hypothetical protein